MYFPCGNAIIELGYGLTGANFLTQRKVAQK